MLGVLAALVVLGSAVLAHDCSSSETGSVLLTSSGSFAFQAGIVKDAVAWAVFNDTLEVSGWGILNVNTNSKFQDKDQMYAAGLAEGYLTQSRIYDHYQNMKHEFFGTGDYPEVISKFFKTQNDWTNQQAAAHAATDPIWEQILNLQNHLTGLADGYNLAAPSDKKLSFLDFQFLQAVGDMIDLQSAVGASTLPNWEDLSLEEFSSMFFSMGHCSGLIKVTGDYSNLFAAHSSWFTFQAMNRIYKHYNFNLNSKNVAAKKMSFSSYPGFLESLDDFYLMDSGLAMVQTTNNIFDKTLYDLVVPQSLFAWQRVRIANTLASSGKQWADIVSKYNSGTYNNQYMVLDYKLFTPHRELPNNTLWVVEQIPGLVMSDDRTDDLRRGYWPSYNIPYFPEIFKRSGYPDIVAKFGEGFSYELAPRAKLFRRDQTSVVDVQSLGRLMRSNNYKTDAYSDANPTHAICSRGDLSSSSPRAGGCYDSKAADLQMMKNLQSIAINGPTTNGGDLNPFQWSKFQSSDSHVGLPDLFDFDWIRTEPLQGVFPETEETYF